MDCCTLVRQSFFFCHPTIDSSVKKFHPGLVDKSGKIWYTVIIKRKRTDKTMEPIRPGKYIQALRQARGLSQEALGALLGTTRQTISKWELDQALPELPKIVAMAELFGTTTDALLRGTLPGAPKAPEVYIGGVWRGVDAEICETERYALYLYAEDGGNCLGMQLFSGNGSAKTRIAVCEHDCGTGTTRYAYRTARGSITNDNDILVPLLGEVWNPSRKTAMRRTETFFCSPPTQDEPLPGVSEVGIERCLYLWRAGDSCTANAERFHFFLCTGQTEYVFSVTPTDTNVYCGASYNYPFALGMMAGGQYFRLRAHRDNTAPYCAFRANFSYLPHRPQIPFDEIALGQCVNSREGLVWCVKRYTEDKIVLQGCGEDEYIYRRYDRREEVFG